MLGWAAKRVTTNLFLLLCALGESFNVMNFFTFMNVFNFCSVAMHYSRL